MTLAEQIYDRSDICRHFCYLEKFPCVNNSGPARGGLFIFTASPRGGEEEHVPKGEERRGDSGAPPERRECGGEARVAIAG